jgi:hypothetical protein
MIDEVRSNLKMLITICAIENVPIENSHFHRLLIEDHGPEVAAAFTYDIELPLEDEQCTTTSSVPQNPLSATA